MTVLVTGSAVHLGEALMRLLLARGDEARGLDIKPSPFTSVVGSIVDYKEFPGRSHFTIGQPGWEEVADYALDWAVAHAGAAAADRSVA